MDSMTRAISPPDATEEIFCRHAIFIGREQESHSIHAMQARLLPAPYLYDKAYIRHAKRY